MPSQALYAIVSGSSWSGVPGGERRARRVLKRLGASLLPKSTSLEKSWDPCVTHVIAPKPSRSFLWVCAAASGTALLLNPGYIDACDESDALVSPCPFEYGRDADDSSSNPSPRLWLGAPAFWKRVGRPLSGHRVAIIGELCPPGANVPSSAMMRVLLQAAGASICSMNEEPTFALVSPNLDPTCAFSGGKGATTEKNSATELASGSVLRLGAAFVPDLIARANVVLAEYIVDPDQVPLSVSHIYPSSYESRPPGTPILLRVDQHFSSKGTPGLKGRRLDTVAPKVGLDESPRREEAPEHASPRETPSSTLGKNDKVASVSNDFLHPGRTSPFPRRRARTNTTKSPPNKRSRTSVVTPPCSKERDIEPPSFEERNNKESPSRPIRESSKRPFRRRIVLESPPSDSEADSSGSASQGAPSRSVRDISKSCVDAEPSHPLQQGSLAGTKRIQLGSVNDDVSLQALRTREDNDDVPKHVEVADESLSAVNVVSLRRRRTFRRANQSRAQAARALCDAGRQICSQQKGPVFQSSSAGEHVTAGTDFEGTAAQLDCHDLEQISRDDLPVDHQSSYRVDAFRDSNSLGTGEKHRAWVGGEMDPNAAFDFVIDRIGGLPTSSDVDCLLAKNRSPVEALGHREVGSGDGGTPDVVACDQQVRNLAVNEESNRRPRCDLEERDSVDGTAANGEEMRDVAGSGAQTLESPRISLKSNVVSMADVFGLSPISRRIVPWPRNCGITLGTEPCSQRSGNVTDDNLCENEVREIYWLLSRGRTEDKLLRTCDVTEPEACGSLVRQAISLLKESTVLPKLYSADQGPFRAAPSAAIRSLFLFCYRVLQLRPSRGIVVALISELLVVREMQSRGNCCDSLVALVSSAASAHLSTRDHFLSALWLVVLRYCEDQTSGIQSFWSVFNEAAMNMEQVYFRDTRDKVGRILDVSDVPPCDASKNGHLARVAWDKWVFNACASFGSLFVYDFDQAQGMNHPWTYSMGPPSLVPNWLLVESLLRTLRDDIQEMANSMPASRSPSTEKECERRLYDVLKRIVLDLAADAWTLEEPVVFLALDVLHEYYISASTYCACNDTPKFLQQLSHARDVKMRGSYLATQLKSPCDCAVVLVWLFLAQTENKRRKVPKLVQKVDAFAKHCPSVSGSDGEFRGHRHYFAFMLALADSVGTPSGSHPTRDLADGGFARFIFAKAPDVARALAKSVTFGQAESKRWTYILESVELRCFCLLGSQRGISIYLERISLEFENLSRCMDASDVRNSVSTDPARVGTAMTRDDALLRTQTFIELAMKMLSCSSTLLSKQDRKLREAFGVDRSTAKEPLYELAAVDSSLAAVSKMVSVSGGLLKGILSQLRSPSGGAASAMFRGRLLESIMGLLEASVELCVSFRRHASPKVASPGLQSILRALRSSTFSGLIDLARRGLGVVELREVSDLLRPFATRVLARVFGLCSLQDRVCVADTSPGNLGMGPSATISFISELGMNSLADLENFSGDEALTSNSSSRSLRRLQNPSAGCSLLTSSNGRRIVAEFWSNVVDTLWLDAVFTVSPELERMVITSWVVLISAPEALSTPQPLLALAWALKNACSSRPIFARFFKNTRLESNMTNASPSMSSVLILDRTQTVVDSLETTIEDKIVLLDKLPGLLLMLECVACRGESVTSGSCAVTDDVGRREHGREKSSSATVAISRCHFAFVADISSLLFVLRAAKGSANVKSLLPDRERSRALLETIVTSLRRSLEMSMAEADSSATLSPDLGAMYGRVATFVLHGLALVGYEHDIQLKSKVQHISSLFPEAEFGQLLRPTGQIQMLPWVSRLAKESHRIGHASSTSQGLLQSRSREAGEAWRRFVIQISIVDPLQSTKLSELRFPQACRRLLILLNEHSSLGSDMDFVARDTGEALARLSQSLSALDMQTASECCCPCTRDSLRLCQNIADKVDAMFLESVGNGNGAPHARRLVALSTMIGQLTGSLL